MPATRSAARATAAPQPASSRRGAASASRTAHGTRKRVRKAQWAADLSPEVQWYCESRGYRLEDWQRPLWRSAEPRSVRGAQFHPGLVDRVLDALQSMHHTQGKWAGHPLKPDAWQVAFIIAPVFGWVKQDAFGQWLRIISSVWVEVPRKNGKTTVAAGLGLFLAFGDGEPGAQVLAAAGSKDQAMNAFRPAYLIAERTPAFKGAGVTALKSQVVRESDQSFMKAVASVGDLLQGTNPSGYIVDEMHVHKSLDVVDALESGTGARDQPLGIIITTADDGTQFSPYAVRRQQVEDLCKGTRKVPSEYAVVFAAAPDADPFAIATWRQANPGFGVSPTEAFMRKESQKAQQSPANLARFLRLNLNRRTKQETRFITLADWDRNAGHVSALALKGEECWAGLDLASVSDLSALCLLFPNGEGYQALWRYWAPEDTLKDLDKRTQGQASQWVDDGFLVLTPGNVTDYDYIEAQVAADAADYRIQGIGFDPYNATQTTLNMAGTGLNMVKVRQGFLTLSAPTKQLQRLVLAGKRSKPLLEHGGNPVSRWCIDNLAVEFDAAENVKPSKRKSGDKIDGVAALVNALHEAMAEQAADSAYAEHGLIVA